MDKYKILKEKRTVLYPLRVFMKHENESDLEHIFECLKIVEELEDKDYYYLTVELSKRLYREEILEKYVKEDLYMASALYKEPYDRAKEEERERLVRIVLKLLTKRFGIIPLELRKNIEKLDAYNLEIISDEILDFNSLDDIKKYIKQS